MVKLYIIVQNDTGLGYKYMTNLKHQGVKFTQLLQQLSPRTLYLSQNS